MSKVINKDKKNTSLGKVLKFVIPSIIGLLLFIIPLPWGNKGATIGVGYMAEMFKLAFGKYLPTFMVGVVIFSSAFTIVLTAIKPKIVVENKFWSSIFIVKMFTLVMRTLAGILGVLILVKPKGSVFEIFWGRATGQSVTNDLFPVLATWFFFSGFFLPLLMEFGLMDFFGTLIKKVMRPLFKVPGRSAIDAVASWIGSGPVGIVITDKQYKEGYYTKQESAIIATCFSLVSLPFAVFIADFLKLTTSFLYFYGTICIASLAAALILPRIYPLSKKKKEYRENTVVNIKEEVPDGKTTFNYAVECGVERAKRALGPVGLVKSGVKTVLDVYLSLMPLVLILGTVALVIAEHTQVFNLLSKPLVPIMNLLKVPDEATAASATIVGFADMFLPSIFVEKSAHEITRFIIGAMSFTQLIYMTETGATILRAEIPLNLWDLFVIFVERTLITLPIVVLIAHLIY